MSKFKLGDIIFCPLYDEGDLLVVSIDRNSYRVVGINDVVDGDRDKIPEDMAYIYEVIGSIYNKKE